MKKPQVEELRSFVKRNWHSTNLSRCSRILSRKDQRRILAVITLQVLSGFLDLIAVAIIGVVGALAVSGVQSKAPGNRVGEALEFLHLSELNFQNQVAILGCAAALILICRTAFSIYFTRKTLFFLSRRGASISTTLVNKLMNQSLIKIQEKSSQDTLYSITSGVATITLGVLGSVVLIVADGSLLIVIGVGLFYIDPSIALATLAMFSLIAFSIYKLMNVKARLLGMKNAELSIKSNERIMEALSSYRELFVRNRRSYYSDEISRDRYLSADILAEIQFMPNVGKYVIETSVVLGALCISGFQFLFQDAVHAVATLSVFLAAGTRVAPAIMRIQQAAIQIKSSLGSAGPTLDLIDSLRDARTVDEKRVPTDFTYEGFVPTVELRKINFAYPYCENLTIDSIDLSVPAGATVSLVGSSGAGKTTLVDLLLGILVPAQGQIFISDLSPIEAISRWPGAIGYVPQDISVAQGSIRENVALGFPADEVDDALVWEALELAKLADFVRDLPDGLNTKVGERGAFISGGQRQRLGIARGVYTRPLLLVMDEATSALDGETEASISDSIGALKNHVTIILIAHRLSTVRNSDIVVYLHEGKILAKGTFEEVRREVPDFDRQAQLMGL
jgi:ATP-binding cassette, subfamily B, bacterial PglK